MANTVNILIKAVDQASKTIGDVNEKAGGLGKTLGEVTKIAGGVVLGQAIINGPSVIGSFVSAASDMNETLSKSNTVFGEQGKAIEKWASGAARDFGQSKEQALAAAGSFGNMFTQLGIGAPVAADMSMKMVELASDFASFHNADITEVLTAQQAAFRGEYDALQKFVPTINAATVEQKALEMTGKATTKELTAQEKALAVQAIMMENAGAAAGDFDRTASGLANQQRILSAEWENAKVKLGEVLLPILQKVLAVVLDHQTEVAVLAGVVGGVMVLAFTAWAVSATAAAVATIAATAPVIAIIAAIALLVAGIVLLIKHWDEVSEAVGKFKDKIVETMGELKDKIAGALGDIKDFFLDHWQEIVTGVLAIVFPPGAGLFLLITHFGEVKEKLGEIAGEIKDKVLGFFGEVKDKASGIWDGLKEDAVNGWNKVKDGIVGVVSELTRRVESMFRGLADLVKTIWNAEIAAINMVIRGLNSALDFTISTPAIDIGPIHIGAKSFHVDPPDIPQIPYLAKGGIVNRPTLAMIGEGGAEAVVPLSGPNARGLGSVINIYVQQPLGTPQQIAAALQPVLTYIERRGGLTAGTTRAVTV